MTEQNLNRQEIRAIAEGAAQIGAERGIARAFRLLGVDINDQQSLNTFRADLIFAHNERKRAERALERRAKIVGTIVIGVLSAFAIGAGSWVIGFIAKLARLADGNS